MGRDDWLALGLARLAAEGPTALLLERICAAAGKTRGSFYHHFEDHADFLDALAEHWRQRHTEALIDLAREGSTADRLRAIKQLASHIDAAVEIGMRRLGGTHERIQAVVDEVDRRRIEYLTGLHQSRAGVARDQAATLARLEYAAYVGSQVLWPGADPQEVAKTGDLLDELLSTLPVDEPSSP